jgi:hypothetical protein
MTIHQSNTVVVGGQLTPSQIAAGVAASLKARSDDPSKQRQFTPNDRAATRTIEEQEMFYNPAIVHGFGYWTTIAASIPGKDAIQVKNFGLSYENRFPTKYEEIVISHKAHVYNLYKEKDHDEIIETCTTFLFFSNELKNRRLECGQARRVCLTFFKTYGLCDRHYS